jgi:pyruvate/2-oxoglutarate dehydrogenase complex dihydrolipoamide dehydrogenase (E3) component
MRLLVLGGGPAGLNAALQARELNAQVTLIEADQLGGTNINRGPAPVRTLARAARLVRDTQAWPAFGLRGPRPSVDLVATMDNAGRVAEYVHDDQRISERVASTGIDVVERVGPARFVDPHTVVAATGRTWRADRIIIAVGGHPGRLNMPGAELALTYTDLRGLTALPGRVAVIGGADTGCQLASILADFGCRTVLLEYGPRLIPRADQDVSTVLGAAYARRGIEVITGASAERLERVDHGIQVHYRQEGEPAHRLVDAVFFAVGWPANIEGLDLTAAGVTAEGGHIPVNECLQTNVGHVFAAGDVNGISMLVPSARHEGRLAAENAVLGTRRRVSHDVVPTGSFTDPEYASVGLTEAEARERYECSVTVVRYDHLLRAVIDGRAEGFCKLIVERHHRHMLGAHVLGEYSAEVIQVAAVAMAANLRIEQLAELQLAFPTFTEALGMAAQQLVRELGLARMPPSPGDLAPGRSQGAGDNEVTQTING